MISDKGLAVGVTAGILILAQGANAGTVSMVQWDVNTLTTSATGGTVDSGFTGTLTIAANANTELADILINDLPTASFMQPSVVSFLGTLNFNAGQIVAGSVMNFSVDNDGDTLFDDFFSASVVTGTGGIATDFGDPTRLILGAALVDISLVEADGSTFSNVPMPNFFPFGSFLEFKLNKSLINSGSRSDASTDMDIFAVVPLPSSVGMAAIGLFGVASLRRRRLV